MAKSLKELTGRGSVWPTLVKEFGRSSVDVDILPVNQVLAEEAVQTVQISTRSDFGAVLYHSGGLLIDHGWVRVLGSGGGDLRGLVEWNRGKTINEQGEVAAGSLFIADDVLGGLFAINGNGVLGQDVGNVYYLAADKDIWEPLGLGYSDFIHFLVSPHAADFYAPFHFDGWQEAVKELTPNQIWRFDAESDDVIASRQIVEIEQWFMELVTPDQL
jgi:hypothetical protein